MNSGTTAGAQPVQGSVDGALRALGADGVARASGGACSRAASCTRASLHIGSNMLALFFIGRGARARARALRLGLIYFVSLAAGSLGVMILEPGLALDRRLGRDLRPHGRLRRDRPRRAASASCRAASGP